MVVLHFVPTRSVDRLTLSVVGETLIIAGQALDFSGIPEGGWLPAAATGCSWIAGGAERIDGHLHIGLILPHGEMRPGKHFAPPATVIDADGPVELPQPAEPDRLAPPEIISRPPFDPEDPDLP